MRYFLVYGNKIKSVIEREVGDVTALPLQDEARGVSLINAKHIRNLREDMGWTLARTFEKLGLVDERE